MALNLMQARIIRNYLVERFCSEMLANNVATIIADNGEGHCAVQIIDFKASQKSDKSGKAAPGTESVFVQDVIKAGNRYSIQGIYEELEGSDIVSVAGAHSL